MQLELRTFLPAPMALYNQIPADTVGRTAYVHVCLHAPVCTHVHECCMCSRVYTCMCCVFFCVRCAFIYFCNKHLCSSWPLQFSFRETCWGPLPFGDLSSPDFVGVRVELMPAPSSRDEHGTQAWPKTACHAYSSRTWLSNGHGTHS